LSTHWAQIGQKFIRTLILLHSGLNTVCSITSAFRRRFIASIFRSPSLLPLKVLFISIFLIWRAAVCLPILVRQLALVSWTLLLFPILIRQFKKGINRFLINKLLKSSLDFGIVNINIRIGILVQILIRPFSRFFNYLVIRSFLRPGLIFLTIRKLELFMIIHTVVAMIRLSFVLFTNQIYFPLVSLLNRC